jgi:hypothetical protein
MVFKA